MAKGSDHHLQPLGICHRFFSFIMNNLIGEGLKRVTLGRAPAFSYESVELPIEDPPRNPKLRAKSNGEVVIEFRHIEGEQIWNPVQEFGSSVHFPKKNGLIIRENTDAILQGNFKGPRGIKHPTSTATRETGPKTTTTITVKESAGNRENDTKSNQLDNNIAIHHQTTPGSEPEEAIRMPRRPVRPLLMSAASNINEKADAFIRSRKEAMSKHYSLEHKKS